jgi:hypothetical protein
MKSVKYVDLMTHSAKYFFAVIMIVCAYTWFGVLQSAIITNEWGRAVISGTVCSFHIVSLLYGFWLKWNFVVLSIIVAMAFLTTALYVSLYWAQF